MKNADAHILNGIENEIRDKVVELIEAGVVNQPKTRADWLRLIRAAIELLPAVPKNLDTGEIIERPRGVSYGED